MFFTAEQIVRLNEQELIAFLDRPVSEATGQIDYKAAVSVEKPDRANAELLKDVSGFANSNGGHLLIGVAEPDREGHGAAFIRGIEEGAAIATAIEQRCAAGIDPRVPGLRVVPVPLSNGKAVVVVHVPPSPSRPHMVIHAPTNTRAFFVRHSETTVPMSSTEIRHAVLSAAAGENDARAYSVVHSERLVRRFPGSSCVMVVDATALVPVEVPWDVTGDGWQEVMFGQGRPQRRMTVKTNNRRTPTVEGIAAADSRTEPQLVFEVHRNGYVGAAMHLRNNKNVNPPRVVLWEGHLDFLRSFGELCDQALATARSDRPYLLRLRIAAAHNSIFGYETRWPQFSEPLERQELIAPDLRRDSGQSFVEVVETWMPVMWNAYGLEFNEDQ